MLAICLILRSLGVEVYFDSENRLHIDGRSLRQLSSAL